MYWNQISERIKKEGDNLMWNKTTGETKNTFSNLPMVYGLPFVFFKNWLTRTVEKDKNRRQTDLLLKTELEVIRHKRISCDGFVTVFSFYTLEYTCCVYDSCYFHFHFMIYTTGSYIERIYFEVISMRYILWSLHLKSEQKYRSLLTSQ